MPLRLSGTSINAQGAFSKATTRHLLHTHMTSNKRVKCQVTFSFLEQSSCQHHHWTICVCSSPSRMRVDSHGRHRTLICLSPHCHAASQRLKNRSAFHCLNATHATSPHARRRGEEFYTSVSPALAAVHTTINDLSDASGRIEGIIRLTSAVDFARHCLSAPLAQFLTHNPDVRLDLNLNAQRMALVKENVDMAIRIGQLTDSNLYATHLFDMSLKLFASPAYLADLATITRPEDLTNTNVIRMRTNSSLAAGSIELHNGKQSFEHVFQSKLTVNDRAPSLHCVKMARASPSPMRYSCNSNSRTTPLSPFYPNGNQSKSPCMRSPPRKPRLRESKRWWHS